MERKTGRSQADKKNGQKWVEGNYDAKLKATAENDDVMPTTPALVTSDHPMSREWSSENLPEILFFLNPPESKYATQSVQYLRDEVTGEIVLSEEGHQVRDFEILPRYISVEVEGWRIEAWRRIDTRITYQDILDRQRTDPTFGGIGLKKPTKNALQNHCYRDSRKLLKNWVEYGRRDEPHRTEVETIEELSYNQVVYNTVLHESSTFKGRLVKFALRKQSKDGLFHAVPVEVTPGNVRQTTFDVLHFLDTALPTISHGNFMTPSMDAAWEMSLLLNERARMHGKQHWSKLGRQCLPITWFDRLKKEKKTNANPTYDGGCSICSWTEGRDEGFTFNQEQEDYLFTPRKRIRASSDSNSDEPLFKKRKRTKFAERYLDRETGSEDEVIIPNGSPQNLDKSSPSCSLAFPIPGRSLLAFEGQEGYDAGADEYDKDATESILSSGRQSMSSSGGLLNDCYQHLPSSTGIFDSPLVKFSGSRFNDLDTQYPHNGIRHAATIFPQPQWEKLGYLDSVSGRPSELPYLDHQDWAGVGDVSFSPTYAHPSFSSQDACYETVATSFASNVEMSDLQAANARMQDIVTFEPQADFLYQSPPRQPGRTTAHGGKLTDTFSSPPPQLTGDFEITPHTYQPNLSTLDSSCSRRHSFDGYLAPNFLLTPFAESIEPNLQWGNGDMDYANNSFAREDAISEDGFNELPPAPSLSAPGSNGMSFLNLLSSDPVMPEQFHNLGPGLSAGNYPGQVFLGHDAVIDDSPSDHGILRHGRQTPPLLEC